MPKDTAPRLTPWSDLDPLPTPAAGGYFGLVGDDLVYAGGTTWIDGTKHWLRTTYRHTSKGWIKGPELPRGIGYGSSVQRPNALGIYAGTDGSQVYGECLTLAPNQSAWQKIGDMQRPILLANAVLVDGRVILAGGTVDAALSSFTDQVWAGDGDRWAIIGRMPHGPIAMSAAAIAGDRQLFLFGGCSAGPVNRNDAVRFDIQSGSWQNIWPVPISARGTVATSLDNRYILLAGGYADSAFSRKCFLYDTQADTYHPAPDLPLGLSGPAIARSGDTVYLCGGEPQMRVRSPRLLRSEITR